MLVINEDICGSAERPTFPGDSSSPTQCTNADWHGEYACMPICLSTDCNQSWQFDEDWQ